MEAKAAAERLLGDGGDSIESYDYEWSSQKQADIADVAKDYLARIAVAEQQVERIATLEREREEARRTVAWVCRKLGIPEDSALSSGEKTIAGEMHVLAADAHGYKVYIKAFKCDDKQGAIARLTVARDEARAEYCELLDVAVRGCRGVTDEIRERFQDRPEWRKGGALWRDE